MREMPASSSSNTAILDAYSAAFSWIAQAKGSYRAQYGPLLDLGVADAFTMPPRRLIQALQNSGSSLEDHAYGFHAHSRFNDAALTYVRELFSIAAACDLAVVNTAGAKGGLNLVAQSFVHKGDLVLTTTPGYPIFDLQAARLGAEVLPITLTAHSRFLPDLSTLEEKLLSRAKVLVINYPNNPTGSTLEADAMSNLVDICRARGILLINDAAYAPITFDKKDRMSLFGHPAAMQCCIEIHTLSKAFQIPGWRAGFVVSGRQLGETLRATAMRLDSGQPLFVQNSVAAVMEEPEYVERLCATVRARLLRLRSVLCKHGFSASMPKASFFLFCRAPHADGHERTFANARDCAIYLAERYGVISIPWTVGDEHYLRFSAAFRSDGDDESVFGDLDRRFGRAALLFS